MGLLPAPSRSENGCGACRPKIAGRSEPTSRPCRSDGRLECRCADRSERACGSTQQAHKQQDRTLDLFRSGKANWGTARVRQEDPENATRRDRHLCFCLASLLELSPVGVVRQADGAGSGKPPYAGGKIDSVAVDVGLVFLRPPLFFKQETGQLGGVFHSKRTGVFVATWHFLLTSCRAATAMLVRDSCTSVAVSPAEFLPHNQEENAVPSRGGGQK